MEDDKSSRDTKLAANEIKMMKEQEVENMVKAWYMIRGYHNESKIIGDKWWFYMDWGIDSKTYGSTHTVYYTGPAYPEKEMIQSIMHEDAKRELIKLVKFALKADIEKKIEVDV